MGQYSLPTLSGLAIAFSLASWPIATEALALTITPEGDDSAAAPASEFIALEPTVANHHLTGALDGSLDAELWLGTSREAIADSLRVENLVEDPVNFGTPAIAQRVNPNEERFLQDPPEPLPPDEGDPSVLPEDEAPDTTPEPELEGDPDEPAVRFPIDSIEVIGSTILTEADLAPIIEPLAGQQVTIQDLQSAADQITQLYLNEGYLTSRAILVDQPITDGIVRIQVIEGSLSEIQIEGNERLNASYIRDRIQLGANVPLRADRLEDQLRLLRIDPLFENVEASLRAGGEVGQSILVVRVTEAEPIFGSASIDNYSPPSVGSERMNVSLGYRNVTGLGDTFSVTHNRTTRAGAFIWQLNYRVPVNPMEGAVQLRAVFDENRVVQEEFEQFGIEGESELYEISFRQPLIRSTREELSLSLGLSHKDGQTFIDNDTPFPFGIGPDENGVSRTTALRFGQDYVRRDVQGAWALRSQFSLGLDWLDATQNEAPIPDSQFFSWLGQAQRVQRIGDDHLLIVQLDLQLTPDSLLPSEQFVLGGGQSLRGYRQNARSGDNGFRFSVEDRITLVRDEAGASIFQLAPFFEMGSIWNHPDNPNQLPDQTFLSSIGLGLAWEVVPNFNLRLDYAVPFVVLDDRGENPQDGGFYFSAGYEF